MARRTSSWRFWALVLMGAVVLGPLATAGGYCLWYAKLRRPPAALEETLFDGVVYHRLVVTEPYPLVLHQVIVSLDAPGLGFLVTPPEPLDGHVLRAQTVSQFAKRYDVQIAVNGDFFEPWYANTPWDYYPKRGDPVDPFGLSVSNREVYAVGRPDRPSLFISCAGVPSFERPPRLCQAISGMPLIAGGVFVGSSETQRAPRTAVGLDRARERLTILVVDGRQPGYSEGISLPDLGSRMLAMGVDDAVNLDGGGSSTLVIERCDGKRDVKNSPIHTRIVGRQRPVANHLGLFLRGVRR